MNTFSKILENQKKNFDNFVQNIKENEINKLVDLFIKHKDKNIYFAGIGKSGNLALHLCDVFKSIGLKSFYLNIMNTTHGDLGCIKNDDIILFFSKSGNTKEILDIINVFNCYKILICSNVKAKIKDYVDQVFIVPLEEEGDINFGLIPSNSISNNITYFNFVFNLFIEKTSFKLEEYKLNHPSGDIGFKTKKVKDFINNDIFVCKNINLSIKEVINILKVNKMGIVFENNNNFYGIITTKDILNVYSSDELNLDNGIEKYINKEPFVIEDSESLISSKMELIKEYKLFKFIPVLNNGKYIGVIDNSKILKYL